jgi:hypothetical protein
MKTCMRFCALRSLGVESPGLLWLLWLHGESQATQTTLTPSAPFAKVKFWQTRQNRYAVHAFTKFNLLYEVQISSEVH